MDQNDRVYVEKLYVAIKRLRPIVRAIAAFDRDLGLRLSRHLDALEIDVRSSL
jgi:hypothetical protein